MTLRNPLTLMHDDTQVPASITSGTSLRQPPKIVNHSSNRCRSDASFHACGGARSVVTATSIFAITSTYPHMAARETKLTALAAHAQPSGWQMPAVVRLRPYPRNQPPDWFVGAGFHCEYVNSLRNRLRRAAQSAIVYPKARGLYGRNRPDRHTHHPRGEGDGIRC